MDFQNYLKISAAEINLELDNFFKKWSKEVLTCSSKLSDLNKNFILASEGGKRLRGALVKLGYEIADYRLPTTDYRGNLKTEDGRHEILKPAAAFEIFQTAILAHDDIIDLSPTRRGKPTIFMVLGGKHYGISQTICLGDIGFFLAQRLITESNFPDDKKSKALASFSLTMLQTGLGQMLDVELPYTKGDKSERDILTVSRFKTARYTLVGPMHLGAILGGGDEKLLQNMEKFGESLGIAFQIQDDILGIFGDEKTLGKSVTSDIEEGKNTLLIIRALKNASVEQTQILNKFYGQGKIRENELGQIKKVFIDTGALAYSEEYAEKLVKEAKKVIPLLTSNSKLQTILTEMADFLVQRDR